MKTLYEAIVHHAAGKPDSIAIASDQENMTYASLLQAINQLASLLPLNFLNNTLAIDIENHAAWAVLDLAVMPHHTVTLPIPPFFSDAQILHALEDAGANALITDQPERYQAILGDKLQMIMGLTLAGKSLKLLTLNITAQALPKDTAKVTYTSGTTGTPKGVCLKTESMTTVAKSIVSATVLQADNRHLSVLPLATLLENVAGLYANLLVGGATYLLPSQAVGFNGSHFDITALINTLRSTRATTAILMPGMLAALVTAYEAGIEPLPDLRFVAVGGASVAPALLQRADKLGLPVYEGYGLSESNSVVALNTASGKNIGSVGKPLPHLQVKVSADQEIMVKGANYLGYTGHAAPTDDWLPTGDIGSIDEDGYLYINGRKKNLFITAFGRNVSPEWLERDLCDTATIQQACVFGEAKPWNTAVIVANVETDDMAIDLAISSVNQQLPEYAQISRWIRADNPFTVSNQQLTPNGRLKRDQIWQHYQPQIDALYSTQAPSTLTTRNNHDVLPNTASSY